MAIDDTLSVTPARATFTSGFDLATLGAGRIVEARVVSLAESQAVLAGRFGTLQVDLSGARVQVGDVLRFEVTPVPGGDGKGAPTLSLIGTTPAAAATVALTGKGVATPETALAEAVGRAAGRQSGLAPLFATLEGLTTAPAGSVPDGVRGLAEQLLQSRLGAKGTPTAATIADAFRGSGLFLESRLAQSTVVAANQDLKAGLMALADALTGWVGRPAATANAEAPPLIRLPNVTDTARAAMAVAAGVEGRIGTAAAPSTTAQSAVGGSPGAAPGNQGGTVQPNPTTAAAVVSAADLVVRLARAAYGGAKVSPGVASPPIRPGVEGAVQSVPSNDIGVASGSSGAVAATDAATGEIDASATAAPNLQSAPTKAGAVPSSMAGDVDAAVSTAVETTVPAPSSGAPGPMARLVATDALGGSAGMGEALLAAPQVNPVAADAVGRTDRDVRPAPPRRGGIPRGQAALAPERAGEGIDGVTTLGRRALERTEGALQRILLGQYAVLDHSGDADQPGATAARHGEWTAEIPLATRDGTAVLQMSIERDGGRRSNTSAASDATGWRVRFALDVEPLGPVTAQVGLAGEHLSIGLWFERPETAARLSGEVGVLRGALEAADIPVDAIHVAAGRPAEASRTAPSGRFVDVSL